MPPGVAGLLPSTAQLTSGNWGVLDSEFGQTFSGDMTAALPGRRLSCYGPMVAISLKGDTACEAPPMLTFDLRLSASGAEAATLGKEMLARFEKFNVTPLLK